MEITLTTNQTLILQGKICPYCFKPSQYIDSSVIYGKSYGMIYACLPCDAYVGVFNDTNVALGRLADKELRKYKKEAQNIFDQIWKCGIYKKGYAYSLLAEHLNIPKQYNHISMFSVQTCKKVIMFAKEIINFPI